MVALYSTMLRGPSSSSSAATLSFATLAHMIRIAHKYQIDGVLEPAVARLAQFFNPGAQWVEIADTHPKRWEFWKKYCGLDIELEDVVEAVEIFHLVEKPECLPFAFYLCCLCKPSVLRNGVGREDGTAVRLSDEDFTRCFQGSLALSKECHIVLQRALESHESIIGFLFSSGECTAPPKRCNDFLTQRAREHSTDESWYPLSDLFNPPEHRRPRFTVHTLRHQLCKSCSGRLASFSLHTRQHLFQDLHRFFSLEAPAATRFHDQ